MRSGIRNHQLRSDNPRCREKTFGIGDMKDLEMEDFEVDMKGDFFGDYKDYSLEEFGLAPVEDDEEIFTYNGDSDDDEGIDDEVVVDGAYNIPLEPNRPNPILSESDLDLDDNANSGSNTQPASRLRGGAEVELRNKPYHQENPYITILHNCT
jgi:hypothetical protein